LRVRRWGLPDEPIPKRPYRNSAFFHLALAGMIVLVAWATGGTLSRALVFAAGFFVVATSWSWWRWRQRLQEERRKQEQRQRVAQVRR
jgi:membrane protein implicated in regulation of membrane protease activity